MPESAESLLTALGREDRSIDGARFGSGTGGARIGELGQLFPKVEPPESSAPPSGARRWSTPTATSTPAIRRTRSS